MLHAGVVALEHIEHNLKIGQGLWQRIANTAEYRVNLIGGGGRLGQDASHVLIPGRGLCGQIVQFARPALDLITRVDLAVQNRPGFSMMSLTSPMLVLKSPTIA